MTHLLETLIQFGLSKSEAKIYIAVATNGGATAAHLAKTAAIQRTAVYPILDKLIEVGLIHRHINNKQANYTVSGPEAFSTILQRSVVEHTKRLQAVKVLRPIIEKICGARSFALPQIEVFEGRKKIRAMLDSYLELWLKSMQKQDDILWGYQDESFVIYYTDWLKKYWSKKSRTHKIKLFSNSKLIEGQLKGQITNRETRPPPPGFVINTTLWISGEFTTIINTEQEPHYAIQIRDTRIAKGLAGLFKAMWGG